jgi:hypothetical protein
MIPEIPLEEYEQRRDILDFCHWLRVKLLKLREYKNFDEIFFERKGRNIKKLIEEALPVSRLGLYLFGPFNDIYVTCFGDNQPPDAVIEIKGDFSRSLKVEVTTTETEETSMRRQALAREGNVVFTGPVRRHGREIIVDSEFVNVIAEEQSCIDLMFNRLLAKTENHKFDKDTAILVCHTVYKSISLSKRTALAEKTYQYLKQKRPDIYGVFYCYLGQNSIDEVTADSISP